MASLARGAVGVAAARTAGIGQPPPGPGPGAGVVVFSSDRTGEFQLYSMALDGSGVRRVTTTEGKTFENALACSGRIATVVEVPGTHFHRLWTVRLDGTGLQRLTDGPGDHMPSWRPDGFQIAFSSDPPDVDIHLINADGAGRRRVTNDPTAEYWPHWSPDAGLFAIHYGRRQGPADVFTVTADGSTYSRVTATGDASPPRWGPGGTEIVYSRTAGGDAAVCAVDPVTLATRPVVTGAGLAHQPTWLPDASRILFVRGRETDADAEIWSVRPDGTGAINLTNAPGSREMWPATACLPPAEVATPTPPGASACVCSWLRGRVPDAVIAHALANPEGYYGWRQPRNPGLPPGPANPLRECLSLENRGVAYHPVYNRPIWRVGCP